MNNKIKNKNFKVDDSDQRNIYKSKKKCEGNE